MQVGNLFIPDDAMVLFTGPFDNSPNASHINPILAPGIINPFDFEDQINPQQLVKYFNRHQKDDNGWPG